jgi:hypothetical protein
MKIASTAPNGRSSESRSAWGGSGRSPGDGIRLTGEAVPRWPKNSSAA